MDQEATAHVRGIVTLEDRFSKGLAGVQRGLGRLGTHGTKAVGNLTRNLERLAVVGAGAGLILGKNIVQSAADFQDSMAAVEKTLSQASKTPENLKKISDGLLEMSTRLPVTAVQLAEIAKQAGQLGIESADDMLRFTETMAKLAAVTELDVGYAAENMGKLRTIFNMSADDVDSFANTLVALENSAASTVQEILNVSSRFAGAGQAAGLSAKQIAAFASTITSLGIRPEAGGSALSRIFQRTGVELANESKKAKQIAKFLKMDLDDAKKLYATDATAFFMKFFKAVNRVVESGTDLEKLDFKAILKGMGITNVRDIDAINKMGEGYAELAKQMGIAEGATTELDDAATSRFASFLNQFQIFQNKLNLIAIEIGNAIMPHLVTAMTTLSDWVTAHRAEITQFAEDVGEEFGKFVKNINPDNINAFVGVIKTAVGLAKNLVSAFMELPDWARNLLIGIYVSNKLTGGVVIDVMADLGGSAFNQFLGRGSMLNPMYVIDMGGGGPGGGGGKDGGGRRGRPGWVPAAGTALLVGSLVNQGGETENRGLIPVTDDEVKREIIGLSRTIDKYEREGRLNEPVNPDRPGGRTRGEYLSQMRALLSALESGNRGRIEKAWAAIHGEQEQTNRKVERLRETTRRAGAQTIVRLKQLEQKNTTAQTRLRQSSVQRFLALEREGRSTGQKGRTAQGQTTAAVNRVARKPTSFTVKNTNRATIFLTVDGKKLAGAVYTSTSTQKTTDRSPYYSSPQFPH